MNNRFLLTAVLAAGLALSAGVSHAGKWGMAGCGVGALIFKDKPGKIQILAATTNDYFAQTSSITSGTSGCVDGGGEMAALFIEINQETLRKDVARGNGETIVGLSKIYQCKNADQFGTALQDQYSELFEGQGVRGKEINDKIINTIRNNEALASDCGVVS